MILALAPFVQFLFVLSYNAVVFLFMPSTARFKLTLVNTLFLFCSLFILTKLYHVPGVAWARVVTFILTGIVAYAFVKKKNMSFSFPLGDLIIMSLILLVSFGYLIRTQIVNELNIVTSISLFFAGGAVFFILISLFVSDKFYSSLNLISPFKIKDPVKTVINEVRRTWHA